MKPQDFTNELMEEVCFKYEAFVIQHFQEAGFTYMGRRLTRPDFDLSRFAFLFNYHNEFFEIVELTIEPTPRGGWFKTFFRYDGLSRQINNKPTATHIRTSLDKLFSTVKKGKRNEQAQKYLRGV